MISTSLYMGDTCHKDEKGQGHVRPFCSGKRFFTLAVNTSHPPQTIFTLLDLTPSLELSKPSISATSNVAGEEDLCCLGLIAVILAPAVEIFPPPPP